MSFINCQSENMQYSIYVLVAKRYVIRVPLPYCTKKNVTLEIG